MVNFIHDILTPPFKILDLPLFHAIYLQISTHHTGISNELASQSERTIVRVWRTRAYTMVTQIITYLYIYIYPGGKFCTRIFVNRSFQSECTCTIDVHITYPFTYPMYFSKLTNSYSIIIIYTVSKGSFLKVTISLWMWSFFQTFKNKVFISNNTCTLFLKRQCSFLKLSHCYHNGKNEIKVGMVLTKTAQVLQMKVRIAPSA